MIIWLKEASIRFNELLCVLSFDEIQKPKDSRFKLLSFKKQFLSWSYAQLHCFWFVFIFIQEVIFELYKVIY
jgi:hypothetical protein